MIVTTPLQQRVVVSSVVRVITAPFVVDNYFQRPLPQLFIEIMSAVDDGIKLNSGIHTNRMYKQA